LEGRSGKYRNTAGATMSNAVRELRTALLRF